MASLSHAEVQELLRRAQRITQGSSTTRQFSQQHSSNTAQGSGYRTHNQNVQRAVHDKPWGSRGKDAKLSSKSVNKVKIPKVGPQHRRNHGQDNDSDTRIFEYRPMRKPGWQIEAEARAEETSIEMKQPPIRRSNFNNLEAEKRKLQLQFQFKGGKALPNEGLPGEMNSHIPMNLIQRTAPRKSFRALEQESKTAYNSKRQRLQELERDFEEVMALVKSKQTLLDSIPPTSLHSIAKVRGQLHELLEESRNINELIEHERSSP